MRYRDITGTTLAYARRGSGPVAVFLHGFPLDHRMWLDQIEGLADIRECIAPDFPGFGRSDPISERALTMESLADGIAEFIGGEAADIVALSMGGYVALALWERHPEVFRTLTLVDTRSAADSEEGIEGRRATAEQVAALGVSSLVEGLLGRLLSPEAGVHVRARLRGMIEYTSPETVVAALEGMARRPDRTPLLEGISVPTLVIVGEEDVLAPPDLAEEMAGRIPDARLVVIPGAGHMTPIEAPAEVTAALREFLS